MIAHYTELIVVVTLAIRLKCFLFAPLLSFIYVYAAKIIWLQCTIFQRIPTLDTFKSNRLLKNIIRA